MNDNLLQFRRFMMDTDAAEAAPYITAATEKLNTLFPGHRILLYDHLTLGVETDSLYSETGIDIYELGLVDGEIPAIRNQRDDTVLTFRL